MAVGSQIKTTEYNAIQSSMNTLMAKNAYGTSGWGQVLNSGQVSQNGKITTPQWNSLRSDILNAYIHQNGSAGTLVSAGSTFSINFVTPGTPSSFIGSISGTTLTVTSAPTGAGIQVGSVIDCVGIVSGTYVSANISGTATSASSSWTLSTSTVGQVQTIASRNMTSTPVTMSVSAVPTGFLEAGQRINGSVALSNAVVTAGNLQNSTLTGAGAAGTYYVNLNTTLGSIASLTSTKIITESDRAAYAALANSCVTSGNTLAASSQASITPSFSKVTKTVAWNGTLTHKVTVTFNSGTGYTASQAAAWYFNSGSTIRITASQLISATPAAKDDSWNKLLIALGTINIGSNGTTSTGSTGTFNVLTTTTGFWQLVTTDTVLVQKTTASTTYTPNDYRILASIDSTTARSVITITIQFRDLDAPASPRIDESVGSSATYPLTSDVELYYASGAVSVSSYLPTATLVTTL